MATFEPVNLDPSLNSDRALSFNMPALSLVTLNSALPNRVRNK